jgi:predicted nucleotidyltransferase
MEEIKDKLGDYKYNFFKNLQDYLDNELIFYGSIKRADYFSNASDIDITVITDNVPSILSKLQNYLKINKADIKKIYQKYYETASDVVSGYKIKYNDPQDELVFDMLIYDEKYRTVVMENINSINHLPTYMILILFILKFFYYHLYLMPKSYFLYFKNSLFYMYFNKKIWFYKKNQSSTIILDNF